MRFTRMLYALSAVAFASTTLAADVSHRTLAKGGASATATEAAPRTVTPEGQATPSGADHPCAQMMQGAKHGMRQEAQNASPSWPDRSDEAGG